MSYATYKTHVVGCHAYDGSGLLCGKTSVILWPVQLCADHEYLADPERVL